MLLTHSSDQRYVPISDLDSIMGLRSESSPVRVLKQFTQED